MIERGGEVIIKMLANVQQKTIRPIIQANVAPGTLIYTDEYNIYEPLEAWGYSHQTVCHSAGEYARDKEQLCLMEQFTKKILDNKVFGWILHFKDSIYKLI